MSSDISSYGSVLTAFCVPCLSRNNFDVLWVYHVYRRRLQMCAMAKSPSQFSLLSEPTYICYHNRVMPE